MPGNHLVEEAITTHPQHRKLLHYLLLTVDLLSVNAATNSTHVIFHQNCISVIYAFTAVPTRGRLDTHIHIQTFGSLYNHVQPPL